MRGLRLYRVHKLPASPTMRSPARPGAVAADMEDEVRPSLYTQEPLHPGAVAADMEDQVRPWRVAHDGAPWRAAHDGAPLQVAHDGAHCQVAHDGAPLQVAHDEDRQGAPSRAQQQRLQKDGKPAAAAGIVAGADEGTGPASGPVESGHCGHLGPRVEELEDALAEAEAEGVRARAARTAAESSYVRLTPEEARARGFRDDEELVMPMPVDSSDEED